MSLVNKWFTASISLVFTCSCLIGLSSCGNNENSEDLSEKVAKVTLNHDSLDVFVGETARLSAQAFNANDEKIPGLEVIWASSNESVATVSSKGVVEGKGDGTATITATIEDISAVCNVVVATRRTITISKTEASINLDSGVSTYQLTASCSDGGEVTWTSSDASIATVDSNGLVTAIDNNKKYQTVEIKASRGEAEAKCVIAITKDSAPEQYELGLGNSNANVAQQPGKWFYFLKTSGGGTGTVSSSNFTSEMKDGKKHDTLEIAAYDVSEKQGDGQKDLEWYLRYQPTFAPGSIYDLEFDITSSVDGRVVVKTTEDPFVVPSNTSTHIKVEGLDVNATPLNIKLLFWGGTEENPVQIKLDNISIVATEEKEEEKPEIITNVNVEETPVAIERVTGEAALVGNPGTWGHFLKTSTGSTGNVDECTISESGKTINLKASNVSSTDESGASTFFRLRYQPDLAIGAQYKVSGYVKANIDGSINIAGSTIVNVTKEGFVAFEATCSVKEKNAFYIQLNLFGESVDVTFAELTFTPLA